MVWVLLLSWWLLGAHSEPHQVFPIENGICPVYQYNPDTDTVTVTYVPCSQTARK